MPSRSTRGAPTAVDLDEQKKHFLVHCNRCTQLYEVKRERMVDPKLRALFILFLGHNSFAYAFWGFSMYYSVYPSIHCDVHTKFSTYFRDRSTV
jgi:hypothetical protein